MAEFPNPNVASLQENEVMCKVSRYHSLLHGFLHSRNPQEKITDDNLEKVAVEATSGDRLNKRLKFGEHPVCNWFFEVSSIKPIHLTQVILSDEHYGCHFHIQSVIAEDMQLTNMNVQNIQFSEPSYQQAQSKGVYFYYIAVEYTVVSPGTFCQDILFIFNEGASIRRQLCVDVLEREEDMTRLINAQKYLETLCHNMVDADRLTVIPFKTSMPEVDAHDESVTKIYKKQNINTFFLTHTTLKDAKLYKNTYKRKMHEILTVEEFARQEHISRFNAVAYIKLHSKLQLGKEEVSYFRYAAPDELFIQLPLSRNLSEDTKSGRLLLRSCNSLMLRQVIPGGNYQTGFSLGLEKYEALIIEKTSNVIYGRISKDCVKRFQLRPNTTVCMYVEFIMSRTPFCDWHRAIDSLPCTCMIFPEHEISNLKKSQMLKWNNDWNFDGCQLNDKQKEAVAAIMTPTSVILPPVLILGPYGTGKTSTIAQALKILLTNDVNSKVILCTHSNSAADLYIREFFDVWYKQSQNERLRPTRLYYSGRVRSTVNSNVQKYCIFDQVTGQFRDPTNKDLESSSLVITTLGTSSCLGSLDFRPTHIIVDEAAQAFECEALTCLTLARYNTRLVLAGDQMQLAPEVHSDLSRVQGLGISILERINKIYEPKHPCRIQLCINYRSHSTIVSLTSKLFYDKQIKAGAKPRSITIYEPVTFIACSGVAVKVSDSTGYYNHQEALEIADRISELYTNWPNNWGPFNENSICVVSHYAEQVYHIRSELRSRGLSKVSVERVLNVQGKQFCVVFISAVRTRQCTREAVGYKNDFGFLTDEKLMNTAITRARDIVAVVGDPVALSLAGSCKFHWRKYIDEASIYGMDRFDYFHYIINNNKSIDQESDESNLNPTAQEFVPRPHTKVDYPVWIENVTLPVTYPIMHCVFRPSIPQ